MDFWQIVGLVGAVCFFGMVVAGFKEHSDQWRASKDELHKRIWG